MEGMTSENLVGPNMNSLRGFEVIDKIKYLLEEEGALRVAEEEQAGCTKVFLKKGRILDFYH